MNDALKMQISAFVDGELPENEAEFLLRRLSQDAAMRQQVAQYLELGRLVRRERDLAGMTKLRGRIAEALGAEPVAAEAIPEIVGSRFITPANGIAVAAMVAVIALVGLNLLGTTADVGVDAAVAVDLAGSYTEPTQSQVLANQPTEQLREYSRRHNNSSYDLGSNDIISRLVSFELREGELVEIEPDPRMKPTESAEGEAGEDQ